MFADLSELTRNQPAGEDISAEHRVHSAREYFHTYLQSLDVERAGLPETFQGRLQRVLGHYGVADLERTPELEEAVFRIFLAQQRASTDVAIVSALLRQWLTEAPPAGSLREEAGLALEHLVAATQVRYPAVGDLARGVVFRWFAQPLLRRARAEVYARVRQSLRHLDRHPDSPDRAERIAAMVAASEPLVRLLGQRIGRPGTDPAPLLEVLTRRYYGNKSLTTSARATSRAARSSPPSTWSRPGWSPPPSSSRSWPTRCAPSASWPRTSRTARTWSPTSTCGGPASPTRTRWPPASAR